MESAHQQWEDIHKRLRNLNHFDQQEEPARIYEAYEVLITAYHEARELNDEMDEIIKEFIKQENYLKQKLSKCVGNIHA